MEPARKPVRRKATLAAIEQELERRIRALPDEYRACRTTKVRPIRIVRGAKRGERTWDTQPMALFGMCRQQVAKIIEEMIDEYDCVE